MAGTKSTRTFEPFSAIQTFGLVYYIIGLVEIFAEHDISAAHYATAELGELSFHVC